MNKRLKVIMSGILFIFLLMPQLMASEVDSENRSKAGANYAPLHPTKEEAKNAANTDLVQFPDPNLEQAVSKETGVPVGEITVLDMRKMSTFLHRNSNISDLTGLEYANLLNIQVEGNQITDLSPLSYMDRLSGIYMSDNQISDLTPLTGMIKIDRIILNNNQISDITPLSTLTNLLVICLENNQIEDLSPISDLPLVYALEIIDNQISDLSKMNGTGLLNLDVLNISGNPIQDISALSMYTKIEQLGAIGCQITDISALSEMEKMYALKLDDNQITDISALAKLKNIRTLSLKNNQISDISVFENGMGVVNLYLSNNQISDITPLSNVKYLLNLDLKDNQITDITPLTNYDRMQQLLLGNNQISDLSPLSEQIKNKLKTAHAPNQVINLEDITVNVGDPISYSIYDMAGTRFDIPLGTPVSGQNAFSASFDEKLNGMVFSGTINQNVYYQELNAIEKFEVLEENELTDEELITKFEVSIFGSENTDGVTVNQSDVNYSTPGVYNVVFLYNNCEIVSELTVIDKFPVISALNEVFTIKLGEKIQDYIASYGLVATEITEGDLTNNIQVSEENVNYDEVGTYPLIFSILDEEGNVHTKTADLIIEKADEEKSEEVVTEEKSETKSNEENNNNSEVNSRNKENDVTNLSEDSTNIQMQKQNTELASTGKKENGIFVLVSIIIIVLSTLKVRVITKAKN